MMRWFAIPLLLLALSGCGSPKPIEDWTATVQVKDSLALVWVEVPGKRIGRDYHPHLQLNDGPEIMMYTANYSFRDLKPGSYALQVQLQTVDHKPLPGAEEKTLTFEVN